MAFPTGWKYRCSLSSVAAKVGVGGVSDFPAVVTGANVPAAAWAQMQSDGRDLRVTAADGVTVLPHELVSVDTTAQTLQMWPLCQSLLSSSSVGHYLYWGNAAATAPSAASQQSVWSDYIAVWHLDSNADATGNGYDLETDTGVTYVSGKIGNCVYVPATKLLQHATANIPIPAEYAMVGWYRRVGKVFNNFVVGQHGYTTTMRDMGFMRCYITPTNYVQSNNTSETWGMWGHGVSGGNLYPVVAGAWGSGVSTAWAGASRAFGFGQVYVTNTHDIACDETRIGPWRDNAWLATELAAQSDPASFWTTGPVETLGGGGTPIHILRSHHARGY